MKVQKMYLQNVHINGHIPLHTKYVDCSREKILRDTMGTVQSQTRFVPKRLTSFLSLI